MARIFISYSHSDELFMNNFIPFLKNSYENDSIWYDDGIVGGTRWWPKIYEELAQATLIIYLVSNESIDSEYCQKELKEALRLNKQILPLIVRRLRPEYPGNSKDEIRIFLLRNQAIDLSKQGLGDAKLVDKLHQSIRLLLENALPTSSTLIQGYNIFKKIGSGGFGEVYLARQDVINRDVAIKVILPTHANQPEFIQHFQQEAEIVARLENPHIVPLYDYWRDPDGAYLVMRYIRGGNLADKLTTSGAFDMEHAAKLLEQIAEALYIAHRNRVIHQDIKPANILLDDDGNAYLTDFGIARDLNGNVNLAEVDSKTMHGSPKYISPEHLRRKEITFRSDIYSLGLLMYEVLTGSPPYEGTQLLELLQQHVRSPLPTLQEKAPHLPPELNQPIMQASLKDPLARYDSVLKFAQDFRQVVNNVQAPNSQSRLIYARSESDQLEDTGRFDVYKPYKGLAAFQESDSHEFYGRSALIAALTRRVLEKGEYSRFLAVIGSSGSGKSSVVRAGLIPALRKAEILGFPQYISTMTPSATPMKSLEAAILKVAESFPTELMSSLENGEYDLNKMLELALPKEGEMLLFIDQFEEVFTIVSKEDERRRFLNLIHQALIAENSKLRVIVAMRADFLDRPLSYMAWGDMLRERSELVPPLKTSELREAIEKPAERARLILDEGLSDMIIEEMNEQAGALPLLQYTLSQLYEGREGFVLSAKVFREIGGVRGALAKRAEEIYSGLTEAQQIVAQIVFPRLVRFGIQSRTRQRVLLSEIYSLDQANLAIPEMVTIYGEQRLLTFDYDSITRFPTLELAHEALIGSWEHLKNWLDDNEGALRLQERLSGEAKQWQEQGQDSSFLAAGTRLAQYNEIEGHPIVSLTKREVDYLNSSNEAEEARHLREKRRQRLIQALAVAMGIFGFIATILAFASFSLMGTAIEARDSEAEARETVEIEAADNAYQANYLEAQINWSYERDFPLAPADLTQTPAADFFATATAYINATTWQPVVESFDEIEMVRVPLGCFYMGSNKSDDEQPIHEICFNEPFWIDQTEVTLADFARLGGVQNTPNSYDGENQPIEHITWFEASDFCALRGGRLPTEAEWEYSARGPQSLLYPYGNEYIADIVIFPESSSEIREVGTHTEGASWVGAMDMSGNVFEWTSSLYTSYPYDAADGREDLTDTRQARIARGGSILFTGFVLRTSGRLQAYPYLDYPMIGFRCVRS